MRIISLNLGEKKAVTWRGKTTYTGIFKNPVKGSITLGAHDVVGDAVVDRKYHGGVDKACYIFSADHYATWKKLYPDLVWQYGMFGENITVKGLNENDFFIGDILRIGGATVQVSQPRQPCFKLGIRFGTQTVLKKFIAQNQPGIYLRVFEAAAVNVEDTVELIERPHNSIRLLEVWHLLYGSNPDKNLLDFALEYPLLSEGCKDSLRQVRKTKFGK